MENADVVYLLFAGLLEYPQGDLAERAQRARDLLLSPAPEAAGEIDRFLAHTSAVSSEAMEELYSSTFDLSPVCSPYAGHHLFGESYKRGPFLVTLLEACRETNIILGNELPDHIAVLLSLLGKLPDEERKTELRDECLRPVLAKMVESIGKGNNAYKSVLKAALLMLERNAQKAQIGEVAHV